MLVNADEAPELDGAEVVAVPATRIAAAQGSTFANLVMVGALAAPLGEPDGADRCRRGRRAARNEGNAGAREAVLEGWRWQS